MAGELHEHLAAVVGAAQVLTDPATRAPYEVDWTRRFSGPSRLVVRPGSTDQVADVVRVCAAAGVPVVPQGGNTGLVGAGVPRAGEVVLSLRRLDSVGAVDVSAARVVAGAGATLVDVQRAAQLGGLEFGVDLAARDSATIGGMVATNAGGLRVVRHGPMRAQVAGMEAVLADGSVVSRLSGLAHDNGGYDLAGLLTGSEGTLGIVTEVSLRLVAAPASRAVALIGVDDTVTAVRVAGMLRRLGGLDSLEIMYADGVALVCEHTGLRTPFPRACAAYLLVEVAGDDAEDRLGGWLADADMPDIAFASAPDDRRRLWAYRERLTESISAAGVPHKLDVAVPLGRLAEFVDAVGPLVQATVDGSTCVIFGHLGVGNLHVNVLGPAPDDERADDAVLRLVAEMGGSVGAEHGIGTAKRRWLHLTRSATDIAAMRAIKRALDPAGLLNPGVLLPD